MVSYPIEDVNEVNKLLPDDILDYIVYTVRPTTLNLDFDITVADIPPLALQVQLIKKEDAK